MVRGSTWRDLALAAGAAAAAIGLLVLGVLLVWTLGRAPSDPPAHGAGEPPTPTPRAIALARNTPEPGETPTVAAAEATMPAATQIAAAPTVAPLILTSASTAEASDDELAPLFAAPGDTAFDRLATGAWTADADTLSNDGTVAVAEPWLSVASPPDSSFAVEAEIRVTGLLDSVCDQSFGLAAGSSTTGQMFGGGIFFPCAEGLSRARITDIALWEDGYNGDPVFAEEEFEPSDDWRVYRFELRGERLRLMVDGESVLSASTASPIEPDADGEAGIWTQGVGVEVREITVYPLPS
jgi:hypothetical protein